MTERFRPVGGLHIHLRNAHSRPDRIPTVGHDERNHMSDNNLFSHPVEAEHVVTNTDSTDPVENPVFSDQDR